MIIVDGQIHLWEKGTPSAHHRQEPYSAEQAIAGMDAAGVDRALVHPVLWDPDSNELAIEAVRKYPDRFAIMGWFYLDDPNGRDLVAHWKERPGMLGLRFYFNERHPQSWFTDGTLDWLWPAAERAGVPVSLGAAMFLPTVGRIAERHPGLKLIVDHMGVPRASTGEAAYRFQPELLALAKYPNVAVKATGQAGYAEDAYPFRSLHPHLHRCFDAFGPDADVLGHRHHPHALLLAAMRDLVHRGTAVAEGPRSRPRDGRGAVQLGRLAAPRQKLRRWMAGIPIRLLAAAPSMDLLKPPLTRLPRDSRLTSVAAGID